LFIFIGNLYDVITENIATKQETKLRVVITCYLNAEGEAYSPITPFASFFFGNFPIRNF